MALIVDLDIIPHAIQVTTTIHGITGHRCISV